MKTYKINNIEVSEESIREIIKNNPELLEEKKVSGRYFFPKVGEDYWYFDVYGDVFDEKCDDNIYEDKVISMGVYRTEQEAELARDKQQAIVRCWKWAQENAHFEPDWVDNKQHKYYVNFCHDTGKLFYSDNLYSQQQFTLPYFKSKEDCQKFIGTNGEDLLMLFTK